MQSLVIFAEVVSACPWTPEEITTVSIFVYTMEGIQEGSELASGKKKATLKNKK